MDSYCRAHLWLEYVYLIYGLSCESVSKMLAGEPSWFHPNCNFIERNSDVQT
jgi:hypothetical protein